MEEMKGQKKKLIVSAARRTKPRLNKKDRNRRPASPILRKPLKNNLSKEGFPMYKEKEGGNVQDAMSEAEKRD